MENLAGRDGTECDKAIRRELERARIDAVMTHRAAGEVAYALRGRLKKFVFTRAGRYWIVDGLMPIEAARELYADPIGRDDVRCSGRCGCPAPDVFGVVWFDAEGYELVSDPEGAEEARWKELVERGIIKATAREEKGFRFVPDVRDTRIAVGGVVTMYHIDSEAGLRLFADTVCRLGPSHPALATRRGWQTWR
jgi:hypothetical protein